MSIDNNMVSNADDNWKVKALVIGTAVGALLGLASAYLLTRTADEFDGQPPHVSTGDIIKVGVAAIGLIRGIASLGEGKR